MKTITRQETAPYVEAVIEALPDELAPVFAGQIRLESALINRFDVVVQMDEPTELELPSYFRLAWIKPSPQLYLGTGYIQLLQEMPIFFWVCTPKAYGSAIFHATGPPEFTAALKGKARKKGFLLRQEGLFFNAGTERLDDGSERSIFRLLDVPWMEPADRNTFSHIDYREQEIIERVVTGSKGTSYLVRIHGSRAHCPCPGFLHRHSCRHLTQVRSELGLPAPLKTEVLK